MYGSNHRRSASNSEINWRQKTYTQRNQCNAGQHANNRLNGGKSLVDLFTNLASALAATPSAFLNLRHTPTNKTLDETTRERRNILRDL